MRNSWARSLLICLILLASVGCDQASKEIAREHLEYKPAVSLLGDTIYLLYTHNPGIAMSLGANWSPQARFWLTIVGAGTALLVMLIIFLLKAPTSRTEILGFSFIIGGGASNLLDRMLRDQGVVDFMMLKVGILRTGIFNVADMLILLGVALLGYYTYKHGRPTPPETVDPEDTLAT